MDAHGMVSVQVRVLGESATGYLVCLPRAPRWTKQWVNFRDAHMQRQGLDYPTLTLPAHLAKRKGLIQ